MRLELHIMRGGVPKDTGSLPFQIISAFVLQVFLLSMYDAKFVTKCIVCTGKKPVVQNHVLCNLFVISSKV